MIESMPNVEMDETEENGGGFKTEKHTSRTGFVV